jgi:hypothetical protein
VDGGRGKRRLWPWLAALAVLGGLAAYNYWPSEPDKIIISRETTYILGPVNADGTPNYVKYLDEKYSQGVTPENNAAPLLLRAFGPDMLPAETRSEMLRRLNLPADMFDGNDAKYFTKWEDRARPAKADANSPASANDANSSKAGDDEGNQNEDWDLFHTKKDDGPMLYEVCDDLRWKGKVHPDLEAWMAATAGPLELIRQATTRERFYMPLVSSSTPSRLLGLFRNAAVAPFGALDE